MIYESFWLNLWLSRLKPIENFIIQIRFKDSNIRSANAADYIDTFTISWSLLIPNAEFKVIENK